MYDRRQFLKLLLASSMVPLLGSGCRSASSDVVTGGDRKRPNVLILLFDTLSARHMSLHDYARATTPNLDRFAERATVYHAHRAAGNFTTPGTASLLTGTYPWQHRAFHRGGALEERYAGRSLFDAFPAIHQKVYYLHNVWANLLMHPFLHDTDLYAPPERGALLDYGFPDRMLSGDFEAAHRAFSDLLFQGIDIPASLFLGLGNDLRTRLGTSRNFEKYRDLYPRGLPTQNLYLYFLVEEMIDAVMDLLRSASRPFLAYFHLFPPHEPYRPRREFVGIFEDGWAPVTKEMHPHFAAQHPQDELNTLRTWYDEYIAHTDAEFGRLYRFIEDLGLLENTYVVITSDHGQLFERGVHGHLTELLYEPVIHVPLLISRPGQREREDVYTPTNCVDLLPTILQALGQPIPEWCDGQPLPGLGGTVGTERAIYALEAKRNAAHHRLHVGTMALIRDRHKLIHYFGYPEAEDYYELYDLENDPEELENLYPLQTSLAADLRDELQAKLAEINSNEPRSHRDGSGPQLSHRPFDG